MLKIRKTISIGLPLLFLIAALACSVKPPVADLKPGANPETEASRIAAELKDAQQHQVDLLSPQNFKEASTALGRAFEKQGRGKGQDEGSHDLATSQAYLNQATNTAKISNRLLGSILVVRSQAIAANATPSFVRELAELDQRLMKLTRRIESGQSSLSYQSISELTTAYENLELRGIVYSNLGPAKANLESATAAGAKKLVPKTLSWANARYMEAEFRIGRRRHDPVVVSQASTEAIAASARLVKMVQYAKSIKEGNPEDLAQEIERRDAEVKRSQEAKLEDDSELANTEERLRAVRAANSKLAEQVERDREFESAREMFSPSEAEVYRQGDQLILRLKGLSFARSKSGISNENMALLTKVQKVLADIDVSKVEVEGHTDSIGTKRLNERISAARAKAVETYLVANGNVDRANIVSSGLGDSDPIASNKTPKGRAQNRRVDVIVTVE